MKSRLQRSATKHWLRRLGQSEYRPAVRAVLLGDEVSTAVILDGTYEVRLLEILERDVFPKISRVETALDIGANIGIHTTCFSKHFDRVIAFEPNPQVAAVLRANAMGHPIEVIEKGLSNAPGKLNFRVNFQNLGNSQIVEESTGVSIEVETLDRLVESLGVKNVGFIKIDVEGHEAQVLAGAQEMLKQQRPIILMEVHYFSDSDPAVRISAQLEQAGYSHFYALLPVKRQREFLGVPLRRFLPRPLRPVQNFRLSPIERIAGPNLTHVLAATEPLT